MFSKLPKHFNTKPQTSDPIPSPKINREKTTPSVLSKYNPPDTTQNIPVLREKWDPKYQSVKTIVEVVQRSPSLSQKPIFPQKGLGKPLRGYHLVT
jgi:hypothetical protein